MAEAVVAGTAVSALGEGAKKASVIARMGAKKAFGEYDIEKVFWQIIYAEGIFAIGFAMWEAYKWIHGMQEIASGDLTGLIPHNCKSALGAGWRIVYTCTACAPPNNVFESKELCEAHLQEASEGEAEKPNNMEDMAWTLCTNVFNKYGGVVMLGIPVLFVLLEYKNLRTRKRALKQADLL